MLFYEPGKRDKSILRWDPFKALIAPRPIGWVSTMGRDGGINLAPYSYFNAIAANPPILCLSSDDIKDTITYAQETGEFVWNMPTYDLRDQMNMTSAPLPRGANEFEHAGLTQAPCRMVKVPRVAESPAALECKVIEIKRLNDMNGTPINNYLLIGQVVGVHINEDFIADGKVDITRMRPIARCGYTDYAVVDDLFEIVRPEGAGGWTPPTHRS